LPVLFIIIHGSQPRGATLHTRTLEAYQNYIEEVEQELLERKEGSLPYLLTSTSPGNLISLSQNQVIVRNLHPKDSTPKGIIHDWLGAVFFQGASLNQVLEVIMDVEQHPEIFHEIVSSEILQRKGDTVTSRAVYRIEGTLTVEADVELETNLERLSPNRARILCRSTRVNEIDNFGQPNQRLLPEGQDRGLIWRLNNYVTLEENGEGVTMECRSIHLSRGLPFGISFILGPFLKKMPPDLVKSMLTALKDLMAEEAGTKPGGEMAN